MVGSYTYSLHVSTYVIEQRGDGRHQSLSHDKVQVPGLSPGVKLRFDLAQLNRAAKIYFGKIYHRLLTSESKRRYT